MLKLEVSYWLASRATYTSSGRALYSMYYYYDSMHWVYYNEISYCENGYFKSYSPSLPLRAVVTLDYSVKIGDKEYNEEIGWNLAK